MSKSLGNFFTVREIADKYDLQVFRFFMLSAHYRSPLNFSAELMEASKNGLERIINGVDHLKHLIGAAQEKEMTEDEKKHIEEMNGLAAKFDEAMDDDFNTADAVSAIFEIIKLANTTASSDSAKSYLQALKDKIAELSDILGLIVEKEEEMLDEEIEQMIEARQAARKARDFQKADEIRNALLEKGIILEDTREGVKWKRA